MVRLNKLPKSAMTGEQLALYEEIVSGRRAASFSGKLMDNEAMLTGPFDVALGSVFALSLHCHQFKLNCSSSWYQQSGNVTMNGTSMLP